MSRARRSSAMSVEGGEPPGAGRVLDLQVVAEEAVEAVERGHGEVVDREPHRPAPVGVAAEHRRRRLRGLVVHAGAQPVELRARPGGRGGAPTATAARAAPRNSAGSSSAVSIRCTRSSPTTLTSRRLLPFGAAQQPGVLQLPGPRAGRGGAGSGANRLVTDSVLPMPSSLTTPPASIGIIDAIDRTLIGTEPPSGVESRS